MRICFAFVNLHMTYAPVTAFLRPVDAAHLARARAASASAQQAAAGPGINKWEILRELVAARKAFALSDRDLSVLEALLSFHPGATLGGSEGAPVVHPSNQTLCERLKGMACSTMRRHLARLVETGLVARRDSPNGKRYVRRAAGVKLAFGFDLSPLIARQAEICAAAETARAEHDRLSRLRETVSLMRRDLAGLSAYGATLRPELGLWDQFADLAALTARALRRKLDLETLARLNAALAHALDQGRDILEPLDSTDPSTNVAQNEQHHQNSETDLIDLELGAEQPEMAPDQATDPDEIEPPPPDHDLPRLPLGLVLTACAEIQIYAPQPIRHWHQLVQAADVVRPLMGISPSAWDDAKALMGPEQAAVVIAAILERFTEIRSPGGYLRALTQKAGAEAFSCGPMIMALMRKAA